MCFQEPQRLCPSPAPLFVALHDADLLAPSGLWEGPMLRAVPTHKIMSNGASFPPYTYPGRSWTATPP
jgi:hypothetical protein